MQIIRIIPHLPQAHCQAKRRHQSGIRMQKNGVQVRSLQFSSIDILQFAHFCQFNNHGSLGNLSFFDNFGTFYSCNFDNALGMGS